jgi:hypothetical protein
MIGLEFIVSDPEEEEGQEMKENILPTPAPNEESVYPRDVPVFARSPSERSLTSSGAGKKSKAFASFRINERSGKASAKIVIPPFPIAFAAAVYIDSAMDGVVCPSTPIPTRSTTQAHARKYRLKALMHTQVNSLPTSKRMRAHARTQTCRMHSYMTLILILACFPCSLLPPQPSLTRAREDTRANTSSHHRPSLPSCLWFARSLAHPLLPETCESASDPSK